ncbi:hypothetical protein WMY93_003828 [Mugilogobius chulae]|uniref:Globin domain-containing protein n=1 Tax=Mugilogobius chulae TaxID=88201 RepID=A0AAW0Q104_9GOBI
MKEQIQYSERLHKGFDADIKPGQMSQLVQEEDHQLNFNLVTADSEASHQIKHPLVKDTMNKKILDAQLEESLVKRLTRQTKIERCMLTQLYQIRSQKDMFIKNNLTRQQQFQQRREKDFQEALEREAALVQQERLARAGEIQRKRDTCKKLAAEQKQRRYMKHFSICKEIMGQVVDLATKAGDYRLENHSLIPKKQMNEWKEFVFLGLPLYESVQENDQPDPMELSKQDNMVGEWALPEEAQLTEIPTKSDIFDHVIMELRNIVHPPPAFPHFIIKACVLGKSCSGKTTCLDKFAQVHGLYVLSTAKLVEEVVSAYNSKDEDSVQQSNPSAKDDQDRLKKVLDAKVTKWALLGEAANKVKTDGKALSPELLVDIITEAIRQLPSNSGWVLDGFPENITQAHLLEKSLGGSVEEVGGFKDNYLSVTDPPKISAPALDLALILDISDDCVASRAAKQTDENNLAMISDRIAAFEDTWPQLENWFGRKQNILVRVNADVHEEELFKAVESIIEQAKKPIEGSLESSFTPDLSFVDGPLPPVLLEELWHISDKRREENEQKMADVKTNEWLMDCRNVLQQHHSTLIQVEVEQFQNILDICKTYYLSLGKQTMPDNRVCFVGEATKARIALIKTHGFERLNFLQSKADQMFNIMEELMNDQVMAEMKSIDHVAEVVRHYMESDPKLQKGFDLPPVQYINPHLRPVNQVQKLSNQDESQCKDKAAVVAFWGKVGNKADDIGADALNRMLAVYPQTKTYFSHWKDLSQALLK